MAQKPGIISFEVVDFEEEMRRIEEEVVEGISYDINERIDYAVEQLRIVTPVDTGEARSGWEVKHVDPHSINQVTGELINEVDHIGPLNNGHSKQAPKLFIEQVLSTIGLITNE
jgi:hypothetical protein